MKRIAYLPVLALPLLAGLAPAPPASGCAPVPPKGRYVAIAQESALIVWDAENKTEHFIRRARFATDTSDFGFLVPTPTKPELAEAPDDLFASLEDWTKPEVVEQVVRREKGDKSAAGRGAPAPASAPGGVEVLDTKRVAGYDAVVLRADDPKALTDWLVQHGYHARPALADWLKPYVEAKWVLTAFKIAKDAQQVNQVSTSAVRMTFQTDRPFYPYREPADQRPLPSFRGRRFLRVFFVGDTRMAGTLGDKGAWPGQAAWANTLDAERAQSLLGKLKLGETKLPEQPWLTVFDDASSPRPGTDEVFFAPSADPSPLARPPVVRLVYEDEPEGARAGGLSGGKLAFILGGTGVLLLACLGAWWLQARRDARSAD